MNFTKKFLSELFHEKRIQSALWQVMMMIVAFTADYGLANMTDMPIASPQIAVLLGIVLSQISKAATNALNKEY